VVEHNRSDAEAHGLLGLPEVDSSAEAAGRRRVRSRLVEAWDRVVASDPGLMGLQLAGSLAVAMGSTLGVEYGYGAATDAGAKATVDAMLFGALVALFGSMALIASRWPKIRTAVLFPVAAGVGMLAGVAVGGHTEMVLGVFVVVTFAAVAIRRFGPPFVQYGWMGWTGYLFTSLQHGTLAPMPAMVVAVVVASAWVLLLSVSVLRIGPAHTLRRGRRAFGARTRAALRACADVLDTAGTGDRQPRRLYRLLHARLARLAEAALMVEASSVEPGVLPPGSSAPVLRRRLIDAQHAIETMATAAEALARANSPLANPAGQIAERFADRDDAGADRGAHALAESAERAPHQLSDNCPAGWLAARQFALAALRLVSMARQPGTGEREDADSTDTFEPVVGLTMGLLPGSPAITRDVPGRGSRWNPLARLDLPARLAIQTPVAVGLASLAGWALSPARYFWAIIAALTVATGTATPAETLLKGAERILGTAVGLVVAIWLAELTVGNTPWALITIVVSVFFANYLFRISYAYTIFFVTIALALLYSVLHEFSGGLLVVRLEETVIGAGIGLAVALALVPLSTRAAARSVRNNLLRGLADLLSAAAGRLSGTGAGPDLDALSRALDDRLRQLNLVARPLTRPLVWANSPPRARHNLALFAATINSARGLAVALRGHRPRDASALAAACRALALASTRLADGSADGTPSAAFAPLEYADKALLTHTHVAPDARATDPTIRSLVDLQQLLSALPESAA
jgi:uncharacterized membrane protein YccC